MAQVLKVSKGGGAVLALSGDEDKVQAAAQLVIGAAAIYDGSVTSITASQVHTLPLTLLSNVVSWHHNLFLEANHVAIAAFEESCIETQS